MTAPTPDIAVLRELQARVRKATGADRELDFELHRIVVGDWLIQHGYERDEYGYRTDTPPFPDADRVSGPEAFTESLDAAVALVERVLPGWSWSVGIVDQSRVFVGYVHNNELAFAGVAATPNPNRQWYERRAATAPLALLDALLTALVTRKEKTAAALSELAEIDGECI